MKKFCALFVLLIIFTFSVFADDQQELDFLLFMPNSGSMFENEEQANLHLDNLVKYFLEKNPLAKQIVVYGYTANFTNEIDDIVLSKERAAFVINELKKRGIPGDWFSDPVGYGTVDTWGSNITEDARIPNRRVRILFDGNILTAKIPDANKPEIKPAAPVIETTKKESSKTKFPWPLFLLLAGLLLLLLLLLKRKKSHVKKEKSIPVAIREETPVIVKETPKVLYKDNIIDLEEEIRRCAYKLYIERGGQSENPVEDWHKAVDIVCKRYQTDNYGNRFIDGRWQAVKEEEVSS